MGLPSVMQVKLDSMRTAANAGQPAVAPSKPKPSAVVSMVPNGSDPPQPSAPAPAPAPEAPLDLSAFAVDPVSAQPGAPASAPAPAAAAPEPVQPADPQPTRVEDEELPRPEQNTTEYKYWLRWKTVAGMFEKLKSDNRILRREHDTLTGKFDLLQQQYEQLRQAPPQPVAPAPSNPQPTATNYVDSLSDDERETYKDSLPVVEKVARSVAQDLITNVVNPLKERLESLGVDTTNLTRAHVNTEENNFVARVRDAIPNMDEITHSDEWKAYMNKTVPFTSQTFGQTLIEAHKERNFNGVVEIFKNFKAPQKPNVAELETPPAARNATDPIRSNVKPILKWSERQRASVDFTKGKISRERLDQINKAYLEAEKEGRIDYNK